MSKLLAGLLVALSVGTVADPAQAAADLARYRWQARVLVLSAPHPTDAAFTQQDASLAKAQAGTTERDLVVVRVVGASARDDRGATLDAVAVRTALGLSPGQFAVALIGKDGGVKRRADAPVAPSDLFATIDAMPMRQGEMGRRP